MWGIYLCSYAKCWWFMWLWQFKDLYNGNFIPEKTVFIVKLSPMHLTNSFSTQSLSSMENTLMGFHHDGQWTILIFSRPCHTIPKAAGEHLPLPSHLARLPPLNRDRYPHCHSRASMTNLEGKCHCRFFAPVRDRFTLSSPHLWESHQETLSQLN